MRVGFAQADITPRESLSLSGFIVRRNQPSEGVDHPIFVRALALASEYEATILLLSFDLLGLGPELTDRIAAAVLAAGRSQVSRDRLILACTHNHSAPATVHLENCGAPSPGYWDQVVEATAQTARSALASLVGPVHLYWELRRMRGVSYNRRRVVRDGRVVMSRQLDLDVVREGPVDDTLFVGRFQSLDGGTVAGFAHFAAHPATVCTQRVTADYPGLLCAGLANYYRAPFLFLQGASGNINPVFDHQTSDEAAANAELMMAQVQQGEPLRAGTEAGPVACCAGVIALPYAPLPSAQDLKDEVRGLERVSDRDLEGGEAREGLQRLANLMNVRPGEPLDLPLARFTAQTMAAVRRRTLQQLVSGGLPSSCELALQVLRVGTVVFPVIAAEVFTETGARLQHQFPGLVIRTVGYGAPLCGYLPTAEALAEGGYEVEQAHVFYGHPAPFAAEAEHMTRARTAELVRKCLVGSAARPVTIEQ